MESWLEDGNADMQEPSIDLGDEPMRLGHRFEKLIQHWFDFHPEYTLKAHNAVLQDAKMTLGELDLLVEKSGKWTHIELACKFYLGIGQSRDWSHWIGVNPQDRLDLKMDKLQRQISLLHSDSEIGRAHV